MLDGAWPVLPSGYTLTYEPGGRGSILFRAHVLVADLILSGEHAGGR